ncbi:unnamed protein product [Pleuronectes platessa]|uniref:Uncharacterized protein n=1 Tax=Pleuronectes platessa TaxID=8262 RepID=A0A9N7V0R3_PLEPL|nr:unnamed protein product [Pleuronectes platessa]
MLAAYTQLRGLIEVLDPFLDATQGEKTLTVSDCTLCLRNYLQKERGIGSYCEPLARAPESSLKTRWNGTADMRVSPCGRQEGVAPFSFPGGMYGVWCSGGQGSEAAGGSEAPLEWLPVQRTLSGPGAPPPTPLTLSETHTGDQSSFT